MQMHQRVGICKPTGVQFEDILIQNCIPKLLWKLLIHLKAVSLILQRNSLPNSFKLYYMGVIAKTV